MKGIVKTLIIILVLLVIADFILISVRNSTMFDGESVLGDNIEGLLGGDNNDGENNIDTGNNALGSSFDNAIVIQAENEGQGLLSEEHKWLSQNACIGKGGELEMEEELIEHNGSWFDIFRLVCVNGDKETYYFNVDSFNGKWD